MACWFRALSIKDQGSSILSSPIHDITLSLGSGMRLVGLRGMLSRSVLVALYEAGERRSEEACLSMLGVQSLGSI